MKNHSIADIESIMRHNDDIEFERHCKKIEKAYLELVERKISSCSAILYVREVK
jgi:hypothetical protein